MKCLLKFAAAIFFCGLIMFGYIEAKGAEEISQDNNNIVMGNNGFALDLYAKLSQEEGNLFFSPYSISTALAMTYAGARGETAKQMADVLYFNLPQDQLPKTFGKLQVDLNNRSEDGNYELSIANALWLEKTYKFLKSYTDLIAENYDAGLFEVDFKKTAEAVRNKINKWVEEKTNNKIKDLIPEGMIDSLTCLVLTNAIYFKGNWASQFKEEKTQDLPFKINPENTINTPLMFQKEDFNYGENDLLQMIELPYIGKELSMIILLPKQIDDLSKLESLISANKIKEWTELMHEQDVVVYLPKFKTTKDFSLADILESMGMIDAFSGKADFSGMTGSKELFISAVIHKAFIDVNEEGTEAAAATAIAMVKSAAPTKPIIFRADHPFVFLIKDNKSGSILFMGRLVNPKE